jgi:hypothetical protein
MSTASASWGTDAVTPLVICGSAEGDTFRSCPLGDSVDELALVGPVCVEDDAGGSVGRGVGVEVGCNVGVSVGVVGCNVGVSVGVVGCNVGVSVGVVGCNVGVSVGVVGCNVGVSVGVDVGADEFLSTDCPAISTRAPQMPRPIATASDGLHFSNVSMEV